MEYSFHIYNKLAADGVTMATDRLLRSVLQGKKDKMTEAGTRSSENSDFFDPSFFDTDEAAPPVIVCVGSDLAIGDSLGPIVGSMLRYKTQGLNSFIYGTLSAPVTAKEIKYLRSHLKHTHRRRVTIVVDAAVGAQGDIGTIKISDSPLYPGAGANKKLGAIGDLSIMGIVAEKSIANYALLNTTRLNLVYSMSEIIADALSNVLYNFYKNDQQTKIL